MSKWGKIPTNDELSSQLQELSNQYFEGRWAVPVSVYDQVRPKGWALARRILRQHNLPQTPGGWEQLTKRITGQEVAPITETRRRNAEQRWERVREERVVELDAPVGRLGSSEWRQAADYRQGLLVIEKWRLIKQWNPRQLCYEVIGKQKVYEVK